MSGQHRSSSSPAWQGVSAALELLMSAGSEPALAGLRKVLGAPGPVYNAILTIPDPGVAAILGWSGFDYVVIDAEHAPFTLESMRSCVDALAASPAASVIRVAANDPSHIKQALDLGVDHDVVKPAPAKDRRDPGIRDREDRVVHRPRRAQQLAEPSELGVGLRAHRELRRRDDGLRGGATAGTMLTARPGARLRRRSPER